MMDCTSPSQMTHQEDKVVFPPMLQPLTLGQIGERERTKFGSFLSDDSDTVPVAPPVASRVGLRSYSQQLEEYITRFRSRPPDIKFWPYGPYWPRYYEGVTLDTPRFLLKVPPFDEPLGPKCRDEDESIRTVDNQVTPYTNRWRGVLIVYDSERSPRDYSPQPVTEGCCPNLVFESRFESGNLRQARRIGMFEYELVLKTDLYTTRHTQWYFFRVHNAQPNVTYKFRIVNLLKSDSLYNYGMRPLVYSEQDATEKQIGWVRTGHHITYTRNVTNTGSPLLQRCVPYYMLEWQMEFPNSDDTYYLAHCYPYTFTDLKDDLDVLMASPERKACVRREVLCESRAGNSCFLITVTNFENTGPKKAVVVSARVHPGESQASWMMKGLLEFVTGPDPVAQELRDRFIFKMVPMLNPDGVIVGNYRCSLAARDLNRNYRHPRRENFPTIYNVKAMVEELAQKHEIMLYCDLHGHSRKHNVFMYGNNTSSEEDTSGVGAARAFISERLFPWLMSSKCPDKFSFRSCKFAIRRCKESTGRVVMWRQMNIYNSFTLEATFSGTILNKENCRHFNILDLMDVGRSLAKVVLDYQHVQENKMQQTEAVLQLTKAITQQILETRGLIGPGSALPDFLTVDKNVIETEAEAVQENAEKWTGAMLTLLQQPPQPDLSAANPDDKGQGRQERAKRAGTASSGLSKEEASKLLDRASLCTMDGCLNILAALNVRDALQESDSSDSDSESEPEMKPPEPKTRKKKRKSRKQRDKEHHDKKQASSDKGQEKEARGKTYSALPALLCAEAPPSNSHGHAFSGTNLSDTSLLTSAQLAKKQPARRAAPVSVVGTQRCLAAEPKQFLIFSDRRRMSGSWDYPGALPGFSFDTFKMMGQNKPEQFNAHPGVSVTSQFMKVVREDGKVLFIPLRHVKRGKPAVAQQPSASTRGSHAVHSSPSSRLDASQFVKSSKSSYTSSAHRQRSMSVPQTSASAITDALGSELFVQTSKTIPTSYPIPASQTSARTQDLVKRISVCGLQTAVTSSDNRASGGSVQNNSVANGREGTARRKYSLSSSGKKWYSAGSNSVLDRLNKDRRSSQFQSKYEGRHNGGVPCFTEERSMERAAKRLAEMKKKYEDDKQRELTLYCVDEHGMYQYPPHMYPNVLSQDDFNHRLHVALSEGTANLSRTLMGMNVKTGYTHADNLQDMHPTINGNNYMLAAHLNGHSSSANHNQPTPSAASPHNNHAHPLAENHRDHR
ncbi:hypothetical protein BaRGS_00033141 [Batillaria attramentaria]|uniref:Peptidase M14 domain-containing protein n=1 Tax=Batillaria attramentaria TaxID=370345 RepID=A0ABD0JLP7_9CAEN